MNKIHRKIGQSYFGKMVHQPPQKCEDLLIVAEEHDIQYIFVNNRRKG